MNASLRIALVVVALCLAAEARAQVHHVAPRRPVLYNINPYHQVHHGYRHHWHPYYHAATAAESYARGWATMTRAQADYNATMAQVRAVDTETRQRQLDLWYQNKETNRQHRESTRKPRPTAEALAQNAQNGRPNALSPNELDNQTGRINWPEALQDDYFAQSRAELDRLFAEVAADGQFDADEHDRLQATTDVILAQLAGVVRQVEPTDYIEAKRFLESLAFQSRQGG